MNGFRIAAGCFWVLCVASPAIAEMSYQSYVDNREEVYVQAYVEGVAIGLSWANVDSSYVGRQPVFCQPGDLALAFGDAAAILDAYLVGVSAQEKTFPIALLMMSALKEKFPC